MGIEAEIAAQRQRYVDFFVEAKARVSAGSDVVGELLISINEESIPYPYRYFRADLVSKNEEGGTLVTEVGIDIDPAFEGRGYNFGTFQVEVHPFAWCRVQIAFDRPPQDKARIEDWITRWLDLDDQRAGEQGTSGAIHSSNRCVAVTPGHWPGP